MGEATVLFYRDFRRFSGGHLKVWDYFNHVRATPGLTARIRFTAESVWDDSNPWLGSEELFVHDGQDDADILFIDGLDWRLVDHDLAARRPVINFVQGVRHADPDGPRYAYLDRRALRICVSPDVADAIRATGRVYGPILTIPNGLDLDSLPAWRPPAHRRHDVLVLGTKQPALAVAVAARLRAQGISVDLIDRHVPRQRVLEGLSEARAAVLLPRAREGFYLPALEAMAVGAIVVCPDCVGNRSFCRSGETCLPSACDEADLAAAALHALALPEGAAAELRERARREATEHSLHHERAAFQRVLTGIAGAQAA